MEEEFDLEKAMAQIEQGATILVPRLTQDEIEAHTRPRKRQAKRKYHFLSFDLSDEEDDLFYEPESRKSERKSSGVASSFRSSASVSADDEISPSKRRNSKETQPPVQSNVDKPPSKSRRRKSKRSRRKSKKARRKFKRSRRKTFLDTAKPDDLTKSGSKPALDKLKPLITTEVKLLKPPKEEPITYMEPSKQINLSRCETKILPATKSQPAATTPANPLIGKIRVKSAAELGSTVIFIDDDVPISTSNAKPSANSKTGNFKKANTSSNNTSIAKTEPSNAPPARKGGIDIQLIGDLYAKLFTTKNQTKIRNVAEILQGIAENIKNNNERVQEITNNKSLTDAEKLMRRCLAFQDLKRKQEENEIKLKEKFETIMAIFDNDNFELLFQLFFLGILKILIVSVSYFYKKGTIFKRLITLLLQSLTNSKFNNERVFKLLRSKDFRERCITLVQFIEKYCKTEFFSMLFLSDADKNLIKNKASQGPEPSTTEERPSSLQRNTRPEVSSVQERESFLLHLLKESKAIDSTSSVATQQQNAYKTYAPATKRAPSALPTTTNAPKPAANTNGPVNSFIFSDGQIKPYPNNVINIHTTEASRTDRPSRPPPPHYQANNYPRRPPAPAPVPVLAPAPGNPVDTTYQNSYNGLHKVQLLNGGLNGTHPISTSNGNIENIQPGSYVAPNKKVGKDNTTTWNGPPNANLNYVNSANAGLRMDHYGGSTTFASPRDPRNIWMG